MAEEVLEEEDPWDLPVGYGRQRRYAEVEEPAGEPVEEEEEEALAGELEEEQEEWHGRQREGQIHVDTSPRDMMIESPTGPGQFHVMLSNISYTLNLGEEEEVVGQLWSDEEDPEIHFFTGDDQTIIHLDSQGHPTEALVHQYTAVDKGAVTGIRTFIHADGTTGRGWCAKWHCWFNMELRNRRWVQTDFCVAHVIPHGANYYVFYYDETADAWRLYGNANPESHDLMPITADSKIHVYHGDDYVPYAICEEDSGELDITTFSVTDLGGGTYLAVDLDFKKKARGYRWLSCHPVSGWRVQCTYGHSGVTVDKDFEVHYGVDGQPSGAMWKGTTFYPLNGGSFWLVVGDEKPDP